MRVFSLFILILVLAGCSSTVMKPFANAELVKTYTIDEFERALIDEKVGYIEALKTELEEDGVPSAVWFRDYPTLAEWRSLKKNLQEGDRVLEYRHRDRESLGYDGPSEYLLHVYLVVRGNRILREFNVTTAIMSDDF